MIRDVETCFSVSTPGGLIVRIELDNVPKVVRDSLLNFGEPDSLRDEQAVTTLSRLTGCPCTIHRNHRVSCSANWEPGK